MAFKKVNNAYIFNDSKTAQKAMFIARRIYTNPSDRIYMTNEKMVRNEWSVVIDTGY